MLEYVHFHFYHTSGKSSHCRTLTISRYDDPIRIATKATAFAFFAIQQNRAMPKATVEKMQCRENMQNVVRAPYKGARGVMVPSVLGLARKP